MCKPRYWRLPPRKSKTQTVTCRSMNEANRFPSARSLLEQEPGRSPCPFCDIVSGRLNAAVLYEDASTLAFLDITAVAEGHTLVIPKQHADDLWSISESDASAVMRTVHRLADRLRLILAPEGLTLFQANRSAGWQDVFHLHVHLVPRWTDDQLRRPWAASPRPLLELEPVRKRLSL